MIALIDLTPKEFALLECFLRMPDKTLGRTRILEQVLRLQRRSPANVDRLWVIWLRRSLVFQKTLI